MSESMNIHWYPGHMAKTKREMIESLRLVDVVCEIVDARIPAASRNPDFDQLAGTKPRMIVLNRADQADSDATRLWMAYFKARGYEAMETDSKSGAGVTRFPSMVRTLLSEKLKNYEEKGQAGRSLRVMIVGVPNVGKSTFINRLVGRHAAKAEDRPGVTRGKQWFSLSGSLEVLDTPGMLWPKLTGAHTGENLAFTGAVRDDILDIEMLAGNLMQVLAKHYPARLSERYRVELSDSPTGYELLERAAKKRGFLLPGGICDMQRMARILLDEFRAGKLGRITLEFPPDKKKQPNTEKPEDTNKPEDVDKPEGDEA